jgi:hypothetical protein
MLTNNKTVYPPKSDVGKGVRTFRVCIQGHHHIGAVHELADVLHGFGLDIAEAHISTDGEVEREVFSVYIPGDSAKDLLDKDKVEEVRQQIDEALLGRAQVVILDMSVSGCVYIRCSRCPF